VKTAEGAGKPPAQCRNSGKPENVEGLPGKEGEKKFTVGKNIFDSMYFIARVGWRKGKGTQNIDLHNKKN